jgi:CRISPR/Cas system-associated endoribonuclease Cas2
MNSKLLSLLVAGLLAAPAFAQTAATEVQRDVNQQTRIEAGLKSGQLNTTEAAKLEREQARIAKAEQGALKDGKLSKREQRRIDRMQDSASADIHAQKHDAQTGNPNAPSSQRMQAAVQRDVNQQTRIENGIKSGELTNHEVARLEKGEARIAHKEAAAARDGHVGKAEQRQIQHAESRESKRIYRQKHDRQQRG